MEPENELHDDPTMIVRRFAAELTPSDGRTVDVRIVPFGERGRAADGHGGLPFGSPYQEEWAPGVFSHQMNAAHRVIANVEHERGVGGIVAKGLTLREGADGVYGSFRFLDTPNGNTALELVRDGVFDSVSLEARPVRNVRVSEGVVRRVKAHLIGLAFCRWPAFSGAKVLAVREDGSVADPVTIDESLVVPTLDADLVERVKALGIRVPGA